MVLYPICISIISIHALREEGDPGPRLVLRCSRAISIHALREEGDTQHKERTTKWRYFYPRPPRGGRHARIRAAKRRRMISIHALREEGDPARAAEPPFCKQFLSTPSARRATSTAPPSVSNTMYFYPRPPRGGRHAGHRCRPED